MKCVASILGATLRAAVLAVALLAGAAAAAHLPTARPVPGGIVVLDLGPAGIRVNAIAPETTESEQVQPSAWIPERHKEHIPRWIPLGRFGTPADAAGCAVFLASGLSGCEAGSGAFLRRAAMLVPKEWRQPGSASAAKSREETSKKQDRRGIRRRVSPAWRNQWQRDLARSSEIFARAAQAAFTGG